MDGRGYFMAVVVTVLVVGITIAAVAIVLYVIYYYLLCGLLARTVSKQARVMRKHQRAGGMSGNDFFGGSSYSDDFLGDDRDITMPGCDFYLTFECGGKEMEFNVPERVFANVEEGDVGLLTHKGTIFRRFIKDTQLSSQTGRIQIRNIQ